MQTIIAPIDRKLADLPMFTIYRNPSDFPGKVVVREQALRGPHLLMSPDPMAITDSIEAARQVIPRGMVRIPRHPMDDPVIVETWL